MATTKMATEGRAYPRGSCRRGLGADVVHRATLRGPSSRLHHHDAPWRHSPYAAGLGPRPVSRALRPGPDARSAPDRSRRGDARQMHHLRRRRAPASRSPAPRSAPDRSRRGDARQMHHPRCRRAPGRRARSRRAPRSAPVVAPGVPRPRAPRRAPARCPAQRPVPARAAPIEAVRGRRRARGDASARTRPRVVGRWGACRSTRQWRGDAAVVRSARA